ncbi:membrane protein insertase YidC [Rathayibacter sp. YIM 133350]|uniref:membrane protein insertase YidC n=1 Tax=Rathayibacter sp. YIM 133350 TaxID=3131992 RepID=UPI00307CFE1E
MDLFGTLLWPLKWVVELLLVGWHWVFSAFGLDPAAGITWVLSIVGLVLVVRAALIPLFVRQIKNQRRMLEVAPQLKKIQDKYKGKKDQFSREAMSRETMALYKRTGTNPLSSCLPLLIQAPIFFALFSVLNDAQHKKAGVGPLNQQLSDLFGNASLFGVAPLHDSFASQWTLMTAGQPFNAAVMWIAATMVVLMTASQFITQLQIVSKNMSPETKASPMFRQQRILLYLLPLVFAFSGIAFPLGVMFYWLTTNIWTMVQQFLVIRNMPTPGSDAAKAREARLARKGKLVTPDTQVVVVEEKKPAQRQQPVSKNRAKKQAPKGPAQQRPQQAPRASTEPVEKPSSNTTSDGEKK